MNFRSYLAPQLRIAPLAIAVVMVLTGCANTIQSDVYSVPQNRIAKGGVIKADTSDDGVTSADDSVKGYQVLTPLQQQSRKLNSQLDLSSRFANSGELTLSADNMPVTAFIHTVFGDLLKANYVLAEDLSSLEQNVSMQVQQPVTQRQLFTMVMQLLLDNNVAITQREDVFFIHKADASRQSSIAIGFGRRATDVPQLAGRITQIAPVIYNRSLAVENVIRELTNVRVEEVLGQSAYSIQGERADVIRALELLNIIDAPAARGRHVGLIHLTYISVEEFVKKLNELLASEGLPIDIDKPGNRNMAVIPLEQIGALALFAADNVYIERVKFWASQLDVPSQGSEKGYFIYHPRYSRANDLGQSVSALLGQQSQQLDQTRDTQSAVGAEGNSANVRTGRSAQATAGTGIPANRDINMTIDERSNSIIFYGTGQSYQNLLPMVKRLDVMPKQILLEATIAEVTLTEEFAMGLEFAIRNGSVGYGTGSAFGVSDIGGLGFSYANGLDRVIAQLVATDSRVNLLSSPSIVVRDGVAASINVGSDIPTVSSTTINPGTETESTSVEYRKTGVELTVTPTISAQGLVVMEIDQKISNTLEGGVQVAGSPSIFERSVKTEVISQSGQSILLGGLMSENRTQSFTKVPGLGDLPLVGALFRSQKDNTTKTELVILITPRVLDNTEQWQGIRDKLSEQMQLLRITDEKVSGKTP